MDFDSPAGVDTTWQRIFAALRSGYTQEALEVNSVNSWTPIQPYDVAIVRAVQLPRSCQKLSWLAGAMAGGAQLSGTGSGAAWRERLCCIPVTVAAERLLTALGVRCCTGAWSHTGAVHYSQSAWGAARSTPAPVVPCQCCIWTALLSGHRHIMQAPEAERLLREAKVQRGRQAFFGQRVALHVLLVGDRQLAEQLQRVRCHTAPVQVMTSSLSSALQPALMVVMWIVTSSAWGCACQSTQTQRISTITMVCLRLFSNGTS
jgi:hypothetical protein